jgi:hypothetical protein
LPGATEFNIEDLQAELRRPRLIQGAMRQRSKTSVNRPVSDLRRILNRAVSREYLVATPFRRGGIAVVKLDKEDLGATAAFRPRKSSD